MRGCNAVYAPEVSDHCPPRVWPLEAAIPEQAADASSALGGKPLARHPAARSDHFRIGDPSLPGLTGRLGDRKASRFAGRFAVDGRVEQGQIAPVVGHRKPDSDRADMFGSQGTLRSDDPAVVPGGASRDGDWKGLRVARVFQLTQGPSQSPANPAITVYHILDQHGCMGSKADLCAWGKRTCPMGQFLWPGINGPSPRSTGAPWDLENVVQASPRKTPR